MDGIRKKIESLLNDWKFGSSIEAKYRCEVYRELLEDIDSLQEEPVSEELEKAITTKFNEIVGSHGEFDTVYIEGLAKSVAIECGFAGARWQEAKDQETIELAEDHAMLAGMEKVREQMMAKAVDGEVTYGKSLAIPSLGYRLDKEGLDFGDKVKVIILKDE